MSDKLKGVIIKSLVAAVIILIIGGIAYTAIIFLAPQKNIFRMWVDFKDYVFHIEAIGNKTISKNDLDSIDPDKHFINTELGIVINKSHSNWSEYQTTTGPEIQKIFHGESKYELMREQNFKIVELFEKSKVIWIKHGEKISIKFKPGSVVSNESISEETYKKLRLWGLDSMTHYHNLTISVIEKASLENWKEKNIWNLFLSYFSGFEGTIKNLTYEPKTGSILIESSKMLKNVIINDKNVDNCHSENKVAFFESSDNLYLVDITYLNTGGYPIQIWNDLNDYLKSLRIIESIHKP
jgi:hypothetical protein